MQKEIYLQIIGKAEKRGEGEGGMGEGDREGMGKGGGGGCILPLYMELEGEHCQNVWQEGYTVFTLLEI